MRDGPVARAVIVSECAVGDRNSANRPFHPSAGPEYLDIDAPAASEVAQLLLSMRIFGVTLGTDHTIVDRHDDARAQHHGRGDGLFRSHDGGHIADRLAPAKLRSVDG